MVVCVGRKTTRSGQDIRIQYRGRTRRVQAIGPAINIDFVAWSQARYAPATGQAWSCCGACVLTGRERQTELRDDDRIHGATRAVQLQSEVTLSLSKKTFRSMLPSVTVLAPRLAVVLTDPGRVHRGSAAGAPQTASVPLASQSHDLLCSVHPLLAALTPVFKVGASSDLARRRVGSPHDAVVRELGPSGHASRDRLGASEIGSHARGRVWSWAAEPSGGGGAGAGTEHCCPRRAGTPRQRAACPTRARGQSGRTGSSQRDRDRTASRARGCVQS